MTAALILSLLGMVPVLAAGGVMVLRPRSPSRLLLVLIFVAVSLSFQAASLTLSITG